MSEGPRARDHSRPKVNLELPPIGWQLFLLGNSKSDSTAFPSFLDTYATRLLAEPLSLRFNHEGFCDVLYLHRKPHAVTVFVGSGALLEGRVALGLAGEPAFGPPRRPTAGFRRLGGRAQVRQKRRNGAMDPDRRKTPRIVAALPRQPQVRNARARQPELGESYHNQPRPPVGLLGVA